ncbi:CoF synthetase [uncultured Aquimarina sp.]|uniref:CoF synthetase n=1 Tax=uncultured Aquimarina sp. TaxID=575652 RepID=UPI0026124066|nr:CoF synthetase [uncultured Aquimarina sp.]
MRLGEKLRNISFWLIDFCTGRDIRKHYKDIEDIIERPHNKKSISKQEHYLRQLLVHASSTTSFYKSYEPSDFHNFPIINKEIVKNSYQEFLSETYKHKKHFSVSTSGSTGTSFTMLQDYNKKKRNTADIIYFSELAGYQLGHKLFYLRFWDMFKKKNKLASFLQNITPINVFDLSDNTIKNLIEILKNDTSNKAMLGYASSFDKICNYLDSIKAEPINCNLRSVIGMSERLDPSTKLSMKKYFGVDMISRYSNAENGMIAQQPIGEEYFEINWASYYVEILDFTSNNRMEYGELGRIVITDLFNYHTPMIRYDTGDLGIMDEIKENGKTRYVFSRVEGRKMDSIRSTSGEILSTSILLVINKYKEIRQRQIIQKTKNEYLFKLKIENHTFGEEKEFIEEFRGYFGHDAIIKLEYVDEIPLLASGKQRAIVNEVKL